MSDIDLAPSRHTTITDQPLPLSAGRWDVDGAHTLAEFSVRHMTVARVTGRFADVSGTLVITDPDTRAFELDVRIGVDSVAAGHPKRDELIRSADFLDAEQFPAMTFHSTRAETAGEGQWTLLGDLTIRGTTRSVELPFTFGGEVTHRGATRAGFSAGTRIDRRDFGLGWAAQLDGGGLVVSHQVDLTLEVELVAATA